MAETQQVISDLMSEAEVIDGLVTGLDDSQWSLPTPAPGWTVADQIAHLTFVFRLAGAAAANPAGFSSMIAGAKGDFDGAANAALAEYKKDSPSVLLSRWQEERTATIHALAAVPAGQVVPWLVNPLPPGVLACAGMMELFAHGQDIADTIGARIKRVDRIGHVVGFGVQTRDVGYQVRGLTPPAAEFRFEITAPSGRQWTFGPANSTQRVNGPAVDFCLLVTRRRHRDDLAVLASGAEADAWLDIAQAYRGPAGPGRQPGQFVSAPS